jgi:hypothetical protein
LFLVIKQPEKKDHKQTSSDGFKQFCLKAGGKKRVGFVQDVEHCFNYLLLKIRKPVSKLKIFYCAQLRNWFRGTNRVCCRDGNEAD